MKNVVVTGCPRADLGQVGALARFGVATVHEAIGRTGYLGPEIRPVHLGARIGGTAVTVVWTGTGCARCCPSWASSTWTTTATGRQARDRAG
jgi:hypothetical protein